MSDEKNFPLLTDLEIAKSNDHFRRTLNGEVVFIYLEDWTLARLEESTILLRIQQSDFDEETECRDHGSFEMYSRRIDWVIKYRNCDNGQFFKRLPTISDRVQRVLEINIR